MRSLKESYEIAKNYHLYWAGNDRYTRFMCLAAAKARDCGDLTEEEYRAVSNDAMTLVKSIDENESSLWRALGKPPVIVVKAYWDEYINHLGI